MTFDAPAFAARLRDLRSKRRLSLSAVGAATGLTRAHVWDLETGRSANPTVSTIWALAAALGVAPKELLGLNYETFVCGHAKTPGNSKPVRNGAGLACRECFNRHSREAYRLSKRGA